MEKKEKNWPIILGIERISDQLFSDVKNDHRPNHPRDKNNRQNHPRDKNTRQTIIEIKIIDRTILGIKIIDKPS